MTKSIKVKNESFESLYSRLWDKMVVVCSRYTNGNIAAAEDFCQDGFIKVYNNLDKLTNACCADAWVRKVIVNNTIDQVRRIKHFKHDYVDVTNLDERVSESEPYSEDSLLCMNDIKNVLHKLSPSYRDVFKLRYIQNKKHKEISKILGVSIGTSKSNLHKARIKVRELLH